MSRLVVLASMGISLGGCAQILGVGDLVYRGPDASADVAEESPPEIDAGADVLDASSAPDGPTTLFVETGLEPTIATDGARVFVRTSGAVQSCPTSGCASPTHVWTSTGAAPRFVAATATRVIWNEDAAVYGCDGATTCATPTVMVDLGSSYQLGGIAASPASSWVLASGWSGSTLRVLRSNLDGTSQDQVVSQTLGGGTAGPVTAAPGSPHVYWSEVGAPAIFDCVSPPCASPDHNTNALASSPLALVATLGPVFFGTTTGLWTADASLGSSQSFAGSGLVASVALSGTTVYFVEHAGATWTIESCPTGTAPCASPAPLHASATAISALVAESAALDWIEGDAVMRMVLP